MKFKFFLPLLLAVALLAPLRADEKDNAPEDGKHPIAVLKGVFSNDLDGFNAIRGDCTIWLKNLSDVTVDGVRMELELYNQSGKKVETLKKEIGEMEAGAKRYIPFEWEVYGATSLKPRVWIYYNAGGEVPVKFEGNPPVWSGI